MAILPAPSHAALSPRLAEAPAQAMPCLTADYSSVHLQVSTSDCQAIFNVEFGSNLTMWSATDQWNFSFAISWIAEVTPAGQIVRLATPLAPFQGSANATVQGSEVNLWSTETMNVTNASGVWNPNNTVHGGGAPWTVSPTPVGMTTLDVTWHITQEAANGTENGTGNFTDRIEFSLTISGWPWLSGSDFLGFELDSLGAGGAHFGYDAANRALIESWNSTGKSFASLEFGATAIAGGWPSPPPGGTNNSSAGHALAGGRSARVAAGPNPNATVAVQSGLYSAGTPDREAVCLVTFQNATGNYSAITYDPWVVFGPSAGGTVPSGPNASGGAGGGIPPGDLVALVLVAATGAVASIWAAVVRPARLRSEGAELVRGMRSALRPPPPPRGPG